MSDSLDHDAVLDFWFGASPLRLRKDFWWRGGQAVDTQVRDRFLEVIEGALGTPVDPRANARALLARIIVLDQFTRNAFRGTARAFAGDHLALETAVALVDRGADRSLHVIERSFACMPFEHAESRAMQRLSVALFADLARDAADFDERISREMSENMDHARGHRDIVERFGRFPHRNDVLGRTTTAEEQAWLDAGAPRFGQ